jgi:hypothetical protein
MYSARVSTSSTDLTVREEGPRAFFKGAFGRVVRSSPQYGCALAAYEYLQKVRNVHTYLSLDGQRDVFYTSYLVCLLDTTIMAT